MLTVKLGDTDAVLQKYDELKSSGDAKSRPPEFALNALGYDSLGKGKIEEAIRIFQKHVGEFPDSSNTYHSLGEAYAAAGKKELAIENYEKSIKLDPKNQNAALRKLKSRSRIGIAAILTSETEWPT